MTGRQRRTFLASAACVGACLLTALVAVGRSSGLPGSWSASAASIALQPDRILSDGLDHFREVADRPLFSPARRPVVPPPPKPVIAAVQPAPLPTPPPEPPASHILAVVIGPERRAAVLQLTNGKTAVVLEGEHIGTWVLTRVLPDRAVLTSPDSATTLSFIVHKKSQATYAPWYSQTGPPRRS